MRVLHVIPSLSTADGGPSFAMQLMEKALREQGVEVTVATTDHDGPGAHLSVPLGKPVDVGGSVRYYFRRQTELYKISLPLSRWVAANVSEFDVVHVHALFSHASVSAARAARRCAVPYVLRPLGVLNRYGMTKRRPGLKWLSLRLVERPLVRAAAAVHYTSDQERREAEESGVVGNALVLPLGLDFAQVKKPTAPTEFFEKWPQARGKEVVLFLSRIDPKKGLELLLNAFATLVPRRTAAILVIAGEGEGSYVQSLERLSTRLGIERSVLWVGFLSGSMKSSALGSARVFVLPSVSENFGLAALEALAEGVPIVLTPGVAISTEVSNAQAGLVVDPEPEKLADAIFRSLDDRELASRLSSSGRRLAEERYSLEAMGSSLKALYDRVARYPRVRM